MSILYWCTPKLTHTRIMLVFTVYTEAENVLRNYTFENVVKINWLKMETSR